MQNLGMDSRVYKDRTFMGDHPRITSPAILAAGENLEYGTVLAKVTASGELKQFAPGASDGTEVAETVLMGSLDASSAAEKCIKLDHGECVDEGLIWPDGMTAANKIKAIASLKPKGIYVV